MVYEFSQVESEFGHLSESELSPVLLHLNMPLEKLKEQLRSGHLALLTCSPTIPLLIFRNQTWLINPAVRERFTGSALQAFQARIDTVMGVSCFDSKHPHKDDGQTTSYSSSGVAFASRTSELPSAKYEYCLDIACSIQTYQKIKLGYALNSTSKEDRVVDWHVIPIQHNLTRIRLLAHIEEFKQLCLVNSGHSLGLATGSQVRMRKFGAHIVSEGLIPIQPVVQYNGRLGLPTTGYFYHFYNGHLIQEYRIAEKNSWYFYGTMSVGDNYDLDRSRRFNFDSDMILVYWKWDGKVVDEQFIVYLERQITLEELSSLSDDWLQSNGVKLDILSLLDVRFQPILERCSEPEREVKNTKYHQVQNNSKTGRRETWSDIAEQYFLTPQKLLEFNPIYNFSEKEPKDLKSGDLLYIEPNIVKKENVLGYPPKPPSTYNLAANSYYEYTERFIFRSKLVALKKKFTYKDVPIVRVKDVTNDASYLSEESGNVSVKSEVKKVRAGHYFYALSFHSDGIEKIAKIQQSLNRYVEDGDFSHSEHFHVTLEFIGHVPVEQEYTLAKILSNLDTREMNLVVNRFGYFMQNDLPLIWLGVNDNNQLFNLQSKLRTILSSMSFRTEDRKYLPHITLGRNFRLNTNIEKFELECFLLPVRTISLIKSKRVDGHLVYDVVKEIVLSNEVIS